MERSASIARPCFLVIDPEHSGSISTRKLVIESAKLNVITAYSAEEALETVRKFPAVDGVVCNTDVRDMPLPNLVQAMKQLSPRMPVVLIGPNLAGTAADYYVESFDPRLLLDTLQGLMPEKVSAIMEREDELQGN